MGTTGIAVEIGGTKLQAALGTAEGTVLALERVPSPADEGAKAILSWFDTSIPALMQRAQEKGLSPSRLGIGFGGPVDSFAGCAVKSHQVSGWDGYPLRAHFEDRFSLPTALYNDSSAAGWGEYRLGAGRGTRQFCYVNIGSGIGGALVFDGKLYDGQGLGAGEVGHTWVPDWTSPCAGSARKLEDLCSGWSIEHRLQEKGVPADSRLHALCAGDVRRLTCAMLGIAASEGDRIARAEIKRIAASIGTALANVVTLLHPQRIAIGGGVSLIGEALLGPVRQATEEKVFSPFRGSYEILPCELGENVVIAGVLLLSLGR